MTVLCLALIAFLELQNPRVEIVPDRQTSFVGKTTVMSVITGSDYSRATGLRKPPALCQAGERSSHQDAASRRSGIKGLIYRNKPKQHFVC